MISRRPILILLILLLTLPLAAQDGQTQFTINCSACHLPDRMIVGPSLVEISKLYGTPDKIPEFIAWCREPKQKRPGVIAMPSMAHVSEDNLKLIHAHILTAAKGLKEVKVKGADRFSASPSMRRRPLIHRIFMPEAGPAAIAVAVNDELHYCWDAGECRLRYIWKGDFIDGWPVWRGNGNGLAKVNGEIFLREERSPLPFITSSPAGRPKFLGYSVQDGLPTFRYRAGEHEVAERIQPGASGQSLERSFTITRLQQPITLTFPVASGVSYASDAGAWNGTTLALEPADAARVTITIAVK